jgi:hypothetical protein
MPTRMGTNAEITGRRSMMFSLNRSSLGDLRRFENPPPGFWHRTRAASQSSAFGRWVPDDPLLPLRS